MDVNGEKSGRAFEEEPFRWVLSDPKLATFRNGSFLSQLSLYTNKSSFLNSHNLRKVPKEGTIKLSGSLLNLGKEEINIPNLQIRRLRLRN